MAFSPQQALDAARNIYGGPRSAEAARLNFIARALRPARFDPMSGVTLPAGYNSGGYSPTPGGPTVEIPRSAPRVVQRLAWKSRTNFLPLVVDTFSQVMKVDGFSLSTDPAEGAPDPWTYAWQANGMDARQTGVVRAALSYGASYATVLHGDVGPAIRGVSPRRMTAVYADAADDDWPMMALDVNGNMLRLYDEEQVYFIGVESAPTSGLGAPAASIHLANGIDWHYIEARPHNMGVCPVVRFRDRMLLEGEEQFGIVEPLIDIQRRIDETSFSQMVAQYFTAFRQRYVLGWVPKSESERMKAAASELWTFTDKDTKVGTLEQGDPSPYLKAKDSALGDMAAIGQVPAQNLGLSAISNISAETLAALEAGKDRKADEITTSFGESWEQVFRLAAVAHGDDVTARDVAAQVRWKNATARSLAQTVDALGKMVQMLGVPPESVWPMIPGWTDQDVKSAKEAIAAGDPVAKLLAHMDTSPAADTQAP